MKSNLQYKVPINGQNVDTLVKRKCQMICQKVKCSRQKKQIKDYPAVVVGCYTNCYPFLYIDTTSSRKDYNKVPSLEEALNSIGRIGDCRNGNIIGACAEHKTAFDVLYDLHCPLPCLKFSKAIRPRTMQVIRYCQNCRDVFGI